MCNREHPAYQIPEQKLRRFGDILDGFEQVLKDDGFDYAEARQWWSCEWQGLLALQTAAKNDPGKLSRLRSEEQRLEAELFQRMDRVDHTSMLFAMGVRALRDPYARRLIARSLAEPDVVFGLLPEGCRMLIASFAEENDPL